MFTWALNVECRKLNVDEHSTLNIQRSTPKAPLHPGSWKGPQVNFDARWDHEPYSGRDGAPPPSAQRNGRTVDSMAFRHRGRGRRRSAVPTLIGFMERIRRRISGLNP